MCQNFHTCAACLIFPKWVAFQKPLCHSTIFHSKLQPPHLRRSLWMRSAHMMVAWEPLGLVTIVSLGFCGWKFHGYLEDHPRYRKWLVSPIYKQFKLFGRGIAPVRGLTITMVINHLLTGMILQVDVCWTLFGSIFLLGVGETLRNPLKKSQGHIYLRLNLTSYISCSQDENPEKKVSTHQKWNLVGFSPSICKICASQIAWSPHKNGVKIKIIETI